MKKIVISFISVCIVSSTLISTSYAQLKNPEASSTGIGGGGGSVKFKDEWELADAFVKGALPTKPGTPIRLTQEMKDYERTVRRLLAYYGAIYQDTTGFFEEQLISRSVNYRSVTVLPCQDDPLDLEDPTLKQVPYGCTQDGVTYLKMDQFNRMSFRNRALALIHERLHARNPGYSHEQIAQFIRGLQLLIKKKEAQDAKQWMTLGDDEALNIDEVEIAQRMVDLLPAFGFKVQYAYRIWPNGGGAVALCNSPYAMDESTFVGVGSMVRTIGVFWDSDAIQKAFNCPLILRSRFVNSVFEAYDGIGYSTNPFSRPIEELNLKEAFLHGTMSYSVNLRKVTMDFSSSDPKLSPLSIEMPPSAWINSSRFCQSHTLGQTGYSDWNISNEQDPSCK